MDDFFLKILLKRLSRKEEVLIWNINMNCIPILPK